MPGENVMTRADEDPLSAPGQVKVAAGSSGVAAGGVLVGLDVGLAVGTGVGLAVVSGGVGDTQTP